MIAVELRSTTYTLLRFLGAYISKGRRACPQELSLRPRRLHRVTNAYFHMLLSGSIDGRWQGVKGLATILGHDILSVLFTRPPA
jgi:hypothetical protein